MKVTYETDFLFLVTGLGQVNFVKTPTGVSFCLFLVMQRFISILIHIDTNVDSLCTLMKKLSLLESASATVT